MASNKSKVARSRSKNRAPIVAVAETILERFGGQVADFAVCLRTPTPDLVPLVQVPLSRPLREFIVTYEPKVEEAGLYAHQAQILRRLAKSPLPNVVLTTATGSGKSLAFWVWAFEALRKSQSSTSIASFPTQALLWGQADRLAKLSRPNSLVKRRGQTYAGEIALGGLTVPWTVWHGTSDSRDMKTHEECEAFQAARIRITTVDKVHWSLFHGKHSDFLAGLRAVVLDEAHMWHGFVGANVRAMLNRLRLSLDLLGAEPPAFFLASATLNGPAEFAASITGCEARSFLAVDDRGSAKLNILPTSDVMAALASDCAEPAEPKRYIFLLKPGEDALSARDLLGDESIVGASVNALCFVQSKFAGHRLCDDLGKATGSRTAIAYDGDMTAEERRRTEKLFFDGGQSGMTIVATSALEIGVDLPELDLMVMDEVPTRRADLLQRLGRVGRSAGRPGLAVLCLGYSPLDARLLEAPAEALSTDGMLPLPLPLHLDGLHLRSMRAAFAEWLPRLRSREVTWDDFNAGLVRYFDEQLTFAELKSRIDDELADLVDLGDTAWFYRGFRASASQGKRPLVLQGTSTAVAQIEDMSVFRDAHPGGVYLGHRGQRFRVVGYRGRFKVGKWTDPRSDIVLGKFIHALEAIEVVEEKRRSVTRGKWKDEFDLYIEKDLPRDAVPPETGAIEYGIWNFLRRFDGYTEIDLSGRAPAKVVPLHEVSRRFKAALAAGDDFPFLHAFSYRTLGWRWKLVRVLPSADRRRELAGALEGLLHAYMCDALECSRVDLGVKFEPSAGELRVLDGTPGGNGLSAALFQQGRAAGAFANAGKAARRFAKAPAAEFARFLAEECHVETDVSAKEVADAVGKLARAWPR